MPAGWISAGLGVMNALGGGGGGGGAPAPAPAAPVNVNVGQSTANTVMTKAAADTKSAAAKQAADITSAADTAAGNIQQAAYQKYADQGASAQDRLSAGFTSGGEFDKKFTMADATNSDAMQFALQQGKNALENSAAARGGLIGTNQDEAAIKFAEGTAGQFQQQAFQQWRQQQQDRIAGLGGLAKQGFDATGRIADAQGNATIAAGGAQAGGVLSMADARAQFLNTAGNNMTGMVRDATKVGGQIGRILGLGSVVGDDGNLVDPTTGGGAYTDPGTQGNNLSAYTPEQVYNNPSAYVADPTQVYTPPDTTDYTNMPSMGDFSTFAAL